MTEYDLIETVLSLQSEVQALKNSNGGVSLNSLYPIGSVYISVENTDVCPLESLGIGKWTELGSGRVLQTVKTGQQVGDVVEAGLPELFGGMTNLAASVGASTTLTMGSAISGGLFQTRGIANYGGGAIHYCNEYIVGNRDNGYGEDGFVFSASQYNSIYGKSSTVQPPAILVKAWKRVA